MLNQHFARRRRRELNLSQAELAAIVGCTQTHISKFESGQRGLKAANLPTLARALGCKIDDLFDDPDAGGEKDGTGISGA